MSEKENTGGCFRCRALLPAVMVRAAVTVVPALAAAALAIELFLPDNCPDVVPVEPALPSIDSWIDPRLRGGRMLDVRSTRAHQPPC